MIRVVKTESIDDMADVTSSSSEEDFDFFSNKDLIEHKVKKK